MGCRGFTVWHGDKVVYTQQWAPGDMHTSRYSDTIMGAMASQIPSVSIVCLAAYWGADERKHQSSASLAFVRARANNEENVRVIEHHQTTSKHIKRCTVYTTIKLTFIGFHILFKSIVFCRCLKSRQSRVFFITPLFLLILRFLAAFQCIASVWS